MNAHECIGKYSGIKIDDNEKQKILNNLPSHCEKPSVIIYILFAFSWLVIPFFAIGTSWAFVEFHGDLLAVEVALIVQNPGLHSNADPGYGGAGTHIGHCQIAFSLNRALAGI